MFPLNILDNLPIFASNNLRVILPTGSNLWFITDGLDWKRQSLPIPDN